MKELKYRKTSGPSGQVECPVADREQHWKRGETFCRRAGSAVIMTYRVDVTVRAARDFRPIYLTITPSLRSRP
jgi:hypothetical protein